MRRWLLPAALLAAAPAAARFVPATDAPYRLALAATRDDGAAVRHFATDYEVAFIRSAGGWRATLRVLPDSARDSRDGTTFATLQQAMAGTPVVVRLDHDGRLLAVEDLEAHWARLRAAIAATPVDGGPDRPGSRLRLLAIHDAATTQARMRALAGDLIDLCAGADTDRLPGERATDLHPTNGAPLPVTEVTTRTRDTVTVVTRDAAGEVERRRVVDRRTGLVREAMERRRIAIRHDGADHVATMLRTARLTLMVSPYPSGTARKP